MPTIYLDNAATTPLDPRVRVAMMPWLDEQFGNPSSRHKLGVRAAEAIDSARLAVARATGARSAHVIFTSGGTEANNLAVLGSARARANHGKHVLIGPTEHPCVRDSAQALSEEGFEVETLRLTPGGALDLDHLAARLRTDTVLVAQMLVQNEFGSIYPVRDVARLVRARSPRATLHVDAVQACGKLEISIAALGCDSLAISAHKLHGPKGSGALISAGDLRLRPLVFGGGQEGGLRSGTENVAGIVGLGTAVKLAEEERAEAWHRFVELRAMVCVGLKRITSARLLEPGGSQHGILPAIVAVLLPGVPSEVRMHHLEERGVVVSAGSACHAKKSEISPALLALGVSAEEARCMLRISFSRHTTEDDVRVALETLESVCKQLESAGR